MALVPLHGRDHRRGAPDPIDPVAVMHYKVFTDFQFLTTGNSKFVWDVSKDMDGMELVDIEIYVTTVSSSGAITIQIHNRTQAVDMLSTAATIDVGDRHSKDAATQPVISSSNDDVNWADEIAVDVDAAGTGAKGLGVVLTFL